MSQVELFKESLKHYANFGDSSIADLNTLGIFISTKTPVFKGLYQSYSNQEASFEFEVDSKFGLGNETIKASFDLENDEIIVAASGVEVKLTEELFLKYLNLIDLCFAKVLPIGTVVHLDTAMMPEDFRKSFGGNSGSMFSITGRKVRIQGKYYVDYVARLFPFGESELAQPFLISNTMIKSLVFKGFSNELETKFVDNVLRKDMINQKGRSLSFLLDDETSELKKQMFDMTNHAKGEDL